MQKRKIFFSCENESDVKYHMLQNQIFSIMKINGMISHATIESETIILVRQSDKVNTNDDYRHYEIF